MAALHSRMPVILEQAAWPFWLGELEGDTLACLRPAPAGALRIWPVSRAVNSVRNNGAALLDPVDDAAAGLAGDALPGRNPA
jgi:putative SOS response-associated peptidase YedK